MRQSKTGPPGSASEIRKHGNVLLFLREAGGFLANMSKKTFIWLNHGQHRPRLKELTKIDLKN